ncbi:MAG TPA: hypothetical protein VKA26_10920 [Ignavibacteriaceae bacterium]|nr:hypothetical protein [Ignavibacteriaceae bacterium]
MIDKEVKADFILYRAEGLTYDEISNLLNVSRPTLIKWNREFEENIYLAKVKIMEELVGEIFEVKRDWLLNQFELLKQAANADIRLKTAAEKVRKRSLKRLGKLFGIKVKGLTLVFGSNYEIDEVKIDCEQ